MSKIKKIKFGKRFLAGTLAALIVGGSLACFKLHKTCEVARVKNYLEDFLTEDNYVDFSKISKDYDIKGFSGESLAIAMTEMDIDYVRMVDSYVYNDPHVETFEQVTGVNYDSVLGIDDYGNIVYEMYEPIRNTSDNGVTYEIPDGYVLETIDVIAEPIRYEDLNGRNITVETNDFDNSYSLELKRK